MPRGTPPYVLGLIALLVPMCSGYAGAVFLSPRLEVETGYEHNRQQVSDGGEGSIFWQAKPGLDVIVFGGKTEAAVIIDYRRTQYATSDEESQDESRVVVRGRYFEGDEETGVNLGGGQFRDAAWPSDDYTYLHAEIYWIHTIKSVPSEVSLRGTVRRLSYGVSVYPSTADRADTVVEVRPGLRWHLSSQTTVWAELYAERNMSDAVEVEYSGFGGSIGCVFRPAPRLDLGAWAGIGSRAYTEQVSGEDRRDSPLPAGAWVGYRVQPWLECFLSASGESCSSTIEDQSSLSWRVGLGIKLVSEHEVW